MGLFKTPIKTISDLFVHALQDMYYAEQRETARRTASGLGRGGSSPHAAPLCMML